jgi:hypothetical protein
MGHSTTTSWDTTTEQWRTAHERGSQYQYTHRGDHGKNDTGSILARHTLSHNTTTYFGTDFGSNTISYSTTYFSSNAISYSTTFHSSYCISDHYAFLVSPSVIISNGTSHALSDDVQANHGCSHIGTNAKSVFYFFSSSYLFSSVTSTNSSYTIGFLCHEFDHCGD